MEYSIIIVTKDKFDLLQTCLDSIIEKTSIPSMKDPKNYYEIIVVNNCSSQETTDLIRDYILNNRSGINISLICLCQEQGFSYANNTGIKYSTGEKIIILNNDTRVIRSSWIEEMEHLLESTQSHIAGSSVCWASLGPEIPEKLKMAPGVVFENGYYVGYFLPFWLIMASRAIFEDIPLNENIKSYFYEDVDFCLRAALKEYKTCCFKSYDYPIEHLRGQTMKNLDSSHTEKARAELLNSWSL